MWRSGACMDLLPSPVFQSNPPSACMRLVILSNHVTMAPDHVDWGMPKSRPRKRLKHLPHTKTTSPSSATSLEGTERNHKGLSPGKTGSGWPAECDLLPGSPEWWQQCGRLRCCGWAAGCGCCCVDDVQSKPQRPWAGKCWCTTCHCLSSSPAAGYRSHDWIFAKTAIMCLEVLLELFEFHRWALTREKLDWRMLLGFLVMLVYESLVTHYDVLDLLWPASTKYSKHVKAPLPTPSLFLSPLLGHPVCAMLPWTQVMMEDPISASCWEIQFVPYLIFCSSWIFLHQTLHLGHILSCSNGHRLATTVVVFKRRSAGLKFLASLVNCRSRWRMVPKTVWQTLKALLVRLPLTIIVIHHCTKTSLWRCFCSVGNAVTLTKHFAMWNKFGR